MPPHIFSLTELPDPLSKLHRLWDQRRGERDMPARADFEVAELAQWLARIALIDVIAQPESFHFKVYGSELAIWSGRDLTGQIFSAKELGSYVRIVDRRAPACIQDSALMGPHTFQLKTLILPLSDDGVRINLLLSCSHRLP